MSPALEAHLRLLATLPVRTHLEKNEPKVDHRGWNGGRQVRTPEKTKMLVKKYRAEGWSYKAIKKELGISTGSISKIISGLR